MSIEKHTRGIALVTAVLLVLVSFRIVYWQLVRGGELAPVVVDPNQAAAVYGGDSAGGVEGMKDLPQPVIQRSIDFLENVTRGSIYDRSGRLLAEDRLSEDGSRYRFYAEPSLAHVIGYVSGLRTGVTGLEQRYNADLLGLDRPDTQVDQILNRPMTGSDLVLTIDSAVQQAAEKALNGRPGSIVVLDSQTGAVLAMASAPTFDPNRILESGYVNGLLESCGDSPACQAPLLNRATQALYPPGSTWKTVALIAALDSGQVTPDTTFDFGEPVKGPDGSYFVYTVDGGTIPDPNHKESALSLEMSYARSANAAFARIGDEMPAQTMIGYAKRFGYGAPGEVAYPLELDYTPAQLAQDTNSLASNNWLRAVTAIGQGELLTSPINVGMMVLSVINDGSIPIPYFVQAVRDPSGRESTDLPNRQHIAHLMKPETAEVVRQMMIAVVEQGSGQKARLPGYTVGGKTGTAQVGGDAAPHAWFAGFAQSESRGVVVVVVLENGGQGSQAAAAAFAQVAKTAMEAIGQPGGEPEPTPDANATVQPTSTPAAAAPDIREDQPVTPPAQPTAQPAATSAPVTSGDQGFVVPTPEILHDPGKNDITAANPSCANQREAPPATGQFIWPSPYQALSGGDFKAGHPGFDLAAPTGSKVYAADTGLVIFSGWSGLGYGNAILIDHGNGFQTLYAHLSSVSVTCGAKVEKGQLIGLSGNTGNSTGPHLHFEVRVPGGWINPVKVLPVP